jgi:predicted RNase H-like HicB family nuclease
VSFPDFPGCITAGSTLEEAREMAQEALAFHVRGLIEDGEALPRPQRLGSVPDCLEVMELIVSADIMESRLL